MVSASDFTQTCNTSIYYTSDVCTPQTCCLEQGQLTYLPTVPGNAIYAAIFIALILPNLWFGIRSKTWSFMTWIILGLIGEFVGYIGRIQLNANIFDFNAFLTYLIPLTIAPAFVTASIYLCLARIIYVVDPALQYTRFKPMTYTKVFVTFDFICLVLQGAGGGMAATADTPSAGDAGVNTMIAGLAFQVVSLFCFSVVCVDFALRLRKGGSPFKNSNLDSIESEPGSTIELGKTADEEGPNGVRFDTIRRTKMFKGFILSLAIAVVLIFVRSSYRLAELKDGFNSELFNDQTLFMIFEGPMIILACVLLTVFHPGLAMRGFWNMNGLAGEGKQKEKVVIEHEDVAGQNKKQGWMGRSLKAVGIGRK